jgi:hypothetical protein
MRVRKVVIAMVGLLVLVWLIPYDLQRDREKEGPPPAAPIVTSPGISATEQADSGPVQVAPASAPSVAEPPAPQPQAPATTQAMALRMWGERELNGPVPSLFQQRENAFLAEPLDPLWARSREAEILGQIGQISGLRLINVEVECRTSTCRLQWTQDVPVPVEGELRGMPNVVYEDLIARLGYTQPIPMGTAADARTITSLTYLPRQHVAAP